MKSKIIQWSGINEIRTLIFTLLCLFNSQTYHFLILCPPVDDFNDELMVTVNYSEKIIKFLSFLKVSERVSKWVIFESPVNPKFFIKDGLSLLFFLFFYVLKKSIFAKSFLKIILDFFFFLRSGKEGRKTAKKDSIIHPYLTFLTTTTKKKEKNTHKHWLMFNMSCRKSFRYTYIYSMFCIPQFIPQKYLRAMHEWRQFFGINYNVCEKAPFTHVSIYAKMYVWQVHQPHKLRIFGGWKSKKGFMTLWKWPIFSNT